MTESKFLKILVFCVLIGSCPCGLLFADVSWSDSPAFGLNLLSILIGGTGDFPAGSSSDFTLDLLWVRRAWADSGSLLVSGAEIPSVKAEGVDELHRMGINGEGVKVGILEFSKLESTCGLFVSHFSTQEWSFCEVPAFNDYHATKVAAIAAGSSSTYVGSAPSSFILSYGIARVQTPGPLDQFRQAMDTGDGFLGLKSFTQEGADVINICIGVNQFDKHDGNHDWEHVVDHIVDLNGISVVIAEGDSDISPYICVPAASFNGITVGGAGSSLLSQQGPWDIVFPDNPVPGTSDNRNKPDMLAPACAVYVPKFDDGNWHTGLNWFDGGTSVATPHVTGAVALLSQVAREQADPNTWKNPMVIKAVLMTSADKLLGENVNQRPWRHTQTQPLDIAQGAGLLNAKSAYELYIHAKQVPGQVPINGWDIGTVKAGVSNVKNYELSSGLSPGDQIIGTLVWNCHVNDLYQALPLTNLDLWVWKKGEDIVVTSYSDKDNVEHIVYTVPYGQGGTYGLSVFNDWGDDENYALAWRTVKQGIDVPINLVSNGDFGTGDLSGWITQGSPIVVGESEGYANFNCARLQNEELIRQFMTLPTGISLVFDYRFEGSGGVLDIYFGTDLVDVISATDTNLHRKRLDLRQQLANYVGQQKDLQLYFIGASGSSVYLDNICVTGDPVIGDFDHNGVVDYADLAELLSYWLKNESSVDIAPQPNGDGIINLKDLALLAENWF